VKNKKTPYFNLGAEQNKAKIYFRKTFSNIFITLTDLCSQVITCKTSGCSGVKNSKRAKKSPYAIENIVKELNVYFKLYNITHVFIILRMKVNTFFRFLLKELAYYGVMLIVCALVGVLLLMVLEVVNYVDYNL
jgi:ribosomal protein S11